MQANSKTLGTGHHVAKRDEETAILRPNPYIAGTTNRCPIDVLKR